ncbi:MAG: hypothetical protein ACRC80_08450 [Waterburya sp.]
MKQTRGMTTIREFYSHISLKHFIGNILSLWEDKKNIPKKTSELRRYESMRL